MNQEKNKPKKEIAIVYMVAGMSSRFGGKIKQFARVGPKGETLMEVSLNQAQKAGFTKIVFIVGKLTEKSFRDKFKESYNGIPICYTKQDYDESERDRPWGTVDALCSIKGVVDCPFVVCNGDDLYGTKTFQILVEHLKSDDGEATVGYRLGNVLSDSGGVNRGIFVIKDNYALGIREEFNITKANLKEMGLNENLLCSMNLFALHPDVVFMLEEILVKFKEVNKGDRRIECLLPNELAKLIKSNKIRMKVYSTNEKWLGITNPADEGAVREELKNS